MDTINETGGKLQSVTEPWANATTHAGKMNKTFFVGIAETKAGREAAKQRGAGFGRPRKLNTDQAQVAAQFARTWLPLYNNTDVAGGGSGVRSTQTLYPA